MKNFFKTIGHGICNVWYFLCDLFPLIAFAALIIGIIVGITSCSVYEVKNGNAWDETKKTIEYEAEIVDMTYSGSDSGVSFYIWYENSLGEDDKARIDNAEFIDFAEAKKYHGTVIVTAEIGEWYGKTVERSSTVRIKEVKNPNMTVE